MYGSQCSIMAAKGMYFKILKTLVIHFATMELKLQNKMRNKNNGQSGYCHQEFVCKNYHILTFKMRCHTIRVNI